MSFQWYSASARDSVRISDINNVQKALEMAVMKTWKHPMPDDYITVTASGSDVSYQWYLWEAVVHATAINKVLLDPKDWEMYTYTVNARKNKYSICNPSQ